MNSFTDDDSKQRQQSFSDADLKRLKEVIQARHRYMLKDLSFDTWGALLARLEAAEKVAQYMGTTDSLNRAPFTPAGELYKAWRKAAGRAE